MKGHGLKIFGAVAVLGVILLIWDAATSLPAHVADAGKAVPAKIDRTQTALQEIEQSYQQLQGNPKWKQVSQYADDEQWVEQLAEAASLIDEARTLSDTELEELLDRDHKDDILLLVDAIARVEAKLRRAVTLAKAQTDRVKHLYFVADSIEPLLSNAAARIKARSTEVGLLNFTADKAKEAHPEQAEALAAQAAEASNQLSGMRERQAVMLDEAAKEQPHLAKFADSFDQLKSDDSKLEAYVAKQIARIGELDRSYVKVLADQKVDYFVSVARASWCEYDNCGKGSEIHYPPVQVDANSYDYFESLNIPLIATIKPAWGSSKVTIKTPKSRWQALRIDPNYLKSQRFNYSEFWVQKVYAETYHRYTVIEDGKVNEGTWEKVSNEIYWANEAFLGMALETKPIGEFADELITNPEPVGMATIATPTMVNGVATGNNRYGEWRSSGGTSFWHYYGMYRLFGDLMGGRNYSYHDWNHYRIHGRRKPYYGRENEYGTYGSYTYSNPRYKTSTYSSRNPETVASARTGKAQGRTTPSIRGAGVASRGKGLSGSGK